MPILHNLRSKANDHKVIAQEFLVNETYRKETANRLYCFHTILSLSDLDKEQATPEVLHAIAKKYLELRGDDILAYAMPHLDSEARHIHVLEGATRYRENRSSSLRKQELQQLKLDMEAFIKEQFPQLEHSEVIHGTGKTYTQEAEYQLQKRTGKESKRQQLTTLVHRAHSQANGKQQFLDILAEAGFLHYERNSDGTPTGVISESGRKYRFKTMGISPEQIMALETKKERTKEQALLKRLEKLRQNNPSINLEK